MGEELETIVVRLVANHPTGSRNRAGFTFTESATAVEVTIEQKKLIEEDKYLNIITRGTAREEGLKNPQITGGEGGNGEGGDKDKVTELTKAQIIEKLTEKGLVEGTDFNKNAKKDVLLDLLNA